MAKINSFWTNKTSEDGNLYITKCSASSNYFASILCVSEGHIRNMLSDMYKLGWISHWEKKDKNRVSMRIVQVKQDVIHTLLNRTDIDWCNDKITRNIITPLQNCNYKITTISSEHDNNNKEKNNIIKINNMQTINAQESEDSFAQSFSEPRIEDQSSSVIKSFFDSFDEHDFEYPNKQKTKTNTDNIHIDSAIDEAKIFCSLNNCEDMLEEMISELTNEATMGIAISKKTTNKIIHSVYKYNTI